MKRPTVVVALIIIINSNQQSIKDLKHSLVHTVVTHKADKSSKFKIHVI